MPVTLHVRDVPDDLYSILGARAERGGLSLRRYVLATSGADAVRAARELDD